MRMALAPGEAAAMAAATMAAVAEQHAYGTAPGGDLGASGMVSPASGGLSLGGASNSSDESDSESESESEGASSRSTTPSGQRRRGAHGSAGGGSAAAAGDEPGALFAAKKRAATDLNVSNSALCAMLGDWCTIFLTVSIGHAELELWTAGRGGGAKASSGGGTDGPSPLGSLACANFWVAYHATTGMNMMVQLSLPTVALRDLRPGVPHEASLVLSTADLGAEGPGRAAAATAAAAASALGTPMPGERADAAAGALVPSSGAGTAAAGGGSSTSSNSTAVGSVLPSLLTLEYRNVKSLSPDAPLQACRLRLQRPTLVVDVGFIMASLQFVVPAINMQVGVGGGDVSARGPVWWGRIQRGSPWHPSKSGFKHPSPNVCLSDNPPPKCVFQTTLSRMPTRCDCRAPAGRCASAL